MLGAQRSDPDRVRRHAKHVRRIWFAGQAYRKVRHGCDGDQARGEEGDKEKIEMKITLLVVAIAVIACGLFFGPRIWNAPDANTTGKLPSQDPAACKDFDTLRAYVMKTVAAPDEQGYMSTD